MRAATGTTESTWARHNAAPAGRRVWPCEELIRAVARRGDVGTAVEVGCGAGGNLWFLAEHATQVLGVEPDPGARDAAAALCRQRGCAARVTLAAGTAEALPVGTGSVDLVVDAMVSQHLPWAAHGAVYREYRRVLRPGGWLFLYHLSNLTTGGHVGPIAWDDPDVNRLSLFPEAGAFCLPHPLALATCVESAGFAFAYPRALTRTYGDGSVAHYTVLEVDLS